MENSLIRQIYSGPRLLCKRLPFLSLPILNQLINFGNGALDLAAQPCTTRLPAWGLTAVLLTLLADRRYGWPVGTLPRAEVG
jgi:hypothetical protein